jgi:hypothetical protein
VVARANNGYGKRSRRDAKQIEQRDNRRIEETRKEREQCDAMRTSLEGISCVTPGLLSKETHGMCVAYEKRCTINSSLHAIQIIFLLVTTAFSMVLFSPQHYLERQYHLVLKLKRKLRQNKNMDFGKSFFIVTKRI